MKTILSTSEWDDSQINELDFWSRKRLLGNGKLADRVFCYDYVDEYEKLLGDSRHKTIVDVGSGPVGGILPTLDSKIKIAVDPLFNNYKHSGWKYDNIDYFPIVGSGENIPLLTGFADIVFCMNALDHMRDTRTAFSEMVRILKTGGKLFLLVNFRKKEESTYCHKMFFDKKLIDELVELTSLKVVHEHMEIIKGHLPAETYVGIMEKI